MRTILLALLALVLALPARAAGPIPVVATLPDLADFTRQIGGPRVEVKSLLTGLEDVHTYEPKVSDVKAVSRARVMVTVGLGLEEWVKRLLRNAGRDGLIVAETSRGASLIADGGQHEGGHRHGPANPHIWLDPANVAVMCRNIAAALEKVDPAGRDTYREGLSAYLRRVDEAAARLRAEVAGLKDRRFLSYHPAWPYFARGFGFELAGVVSAIPGHEPSAKAMAALIERVRAEKIRVLVSEPQLSSKVPRLLAQEAGIRVVVLSDLLGYGSTKTYVEHMEENVRTLVSALREAPP
ncbi:MAG: zinc ABC transporter substrate-binding protein [Deltaproteobacteria bacterium]|nr:zinc ABC transporter substrate-binding protein [Deltaproteobacteria bacterium]